MQVCNFSTKYKITTS